MPIAPRALSPLLGWTVLDAGLAAAIALGFGLFVGAALAGLQAFGVNVGPPQAALGGLPAVYVPLSLLGTLFAGAVLWAWHRQALPAMPPPWTLRLAGLAIAVALGLQGLALGLSALTASLGLSSRGSNLPVLHAAFHAAPVATLFATLVLAPLGEELVFRRVLLHRFVAAGHGALGLLVSSLLFALMHEPWPGGRSWLLWALTLLPYALLGAGFGALYWRSGRLDVVIVAHALVNALGLALLLLPRP